LTDRIRENWPIFPLLFALACSPTAPAPAPGSSRTDGGSRPDGAAGTDGGGQPPASANLLACQKLKGAPSSQITGNPIYDYNKPGPPIMMTGQSYRVNLPPPPAAGHVTFKVPASGDYVIFTSRAVPITVFTPDGIKLSAKDVEGSISECTEVKGREIYELQTDKEAHVIRLSGDASQTVDVMIAAP
jgi:hypothetical protein